MTNSTLAILAADPSRIEDVARAELPALIGEAARLHALLQAQLLSVPAVEKPVASSNGSGPLLKATEAAERLNVSTRWVYRHADELPFTKRLTNGTLRFDERGLKRWQERR